MDRDEFWRIIEASREKAKGDPDAQMELLRGEVGKLSTEEVVSFGRHFDALRSDAYRFVISQNVSACSFRSLQRKEL
jgi:Protein of unknown function (DUF4240)